MDLTDNPRLQRRMAEDSLQPLIPQVRFIRKLGGISESCLSWLVAKEPVANYQHMLCIRKAENILDFLLHAISIHLLQSRDY